MNSTTHEIAQALARLDSRGMDVSEEVIPTRLLHALLRASPETGRHLVQSASPLRWARGGRAQGDLVCYDETGRVLAHVEIKSSRAQINQTSGPCYRQGCESGKSQLEHMLEDGAPIVLIAPPRSRSASQFLSEPQEVHEATTHKTWSDVSSIVLGQPDESVPHLLEAILGT